MDTGFRRYDKGRYDKDGGATPPLPMLK